MVTAQTHSNARMIVLLCFDFGQNGIPLRLLSERFTVITLIIIHSGFVPWHFDINSTLIGK